jgi:hypothetical protein
MVREVFGLEVRIIPDPVVGTPLCIPIGRLNGGDPARQMLAETVSE